MLVINQHIGHYSDRKALSFRRFIGVPKTRACRISAICFIRMKAVVLSMNLGIRTVTRLICRLVSLSYKVVRDTLAIEEVAPALPA